MAVLEKELLQAKEATAQLSDKIVKVSASEKATSLTLNQLMSEKEEM